jgi:hypothetical protein
MPFFGLRIKDETILDESHNTTAADSHAVGYFVVLCPEEHRKKQVLAIIHSKVQHLLQWNAGLYRRFIGKGERQPRQLH